VCFSADMINRIMTPRAAALAFAAPLLLATPAFADQESSKRIGATISVQTDNGGFYINTGSSRYANNGYNRRHHNYRVNEYGQTRAEVRRLKSRAVRACRRAIVNQAHAVGFRDVDFDDGRRAHQIGPHGFRVTFNEVEFESRRRDKERRVTCMVRRGDQVRNIEGIPHLRRGHNDHRRHRGYRGR